MMKTLFTVFVCASLCALAQDPMPLPVPGGQRFPPQLQLFLELTGEQVRSINRLNTDLQAFINGKQLRAAQVRIEIAQWTAHDPIVPIELGLRYAELETIRREINDEQGRTRMRVRAVLNETQQAKLKLLDDAAKLQPRISEATQVNLLEPTPVALPVVRFPLPGSDDPPVFSPGTPTP